VAAHFHLLELETYRDCWIKLREETDPHVRFCFISGDTTAIIFASASQPSGINLPLFWKNQDLKKNIACKDLSE
jgi:hypothetical protein